MSRNTAAVESSFQASQIKHRVLVDISSTTGGDLHVCIGGNFIFTGGNTYTPIGGLGAIDPPVEGSDVFARAVTLRMAAVNTAQLVDLAAENLFNKRVKLWRCILSDSFTIVDTPQLWFIGRINTAKMTINDPQQGNYYEVEVESRLKQNPRAMYYDTQTLRVAMGQSGDTFFTQLVNIPNFKGEWGKIATNGTFEGSPGIGPGTGPGNGGRPF